MGATGWEIETMKNYEDPVKSVSMRDSWGIRWCSRVILGTKEAIRGSAVGTTRNISTLRKSQDLTNLARFWVELGTGNVPINLYFMFTGKNCWSIDIELKHIKQGLVEKPSGN